MPATTPLGHNRRVHTGRLFLRTAAAALCLLGACLLTPAQGAQPDVVQGTLRIEVKLPGEGGSLLPVSRHALLISANPTSASPRRVLTGPDGAVVVRLRPGNYTVESDEPVSFGGRGYSWTETLDVPAGPETLLQLTDRNAELGAVQTSASARPARVGADPTLLLPRWKESVVRIWTPSTHATGFVVDAAGLVATSQRAIGDATTAEVQYGSGVKVAASVVASDAASDVAFVRVHPTSIPSGVVPLSCGSPIPPLADGAQVATLGAPLNEPTALMTGDVVDVTPQAITADMALVPGSAGGPVFTPDGTLIGITSMEQGEERRRRTRIVPIAGACALLVSAAPASAPAPSPTVLPGDPVASIPAAVLQAIARKRAGSLAPYRMTMSGFDVAFITPAMAWAARQPDRHTTSADTHLTADQSRLPAWSDFGPWGDYLESNLPVLLVRVTPKLTESVWAKLARGAAMTQGVNLSAFTRVDASFQRLRASCGGRDILPIHPFTIESPLNGDNTLVEGLYVFAADAFTSGCASPTLTVFSQKDTQKGDTASIEPAILKQIADDFRAIATP